MRTLTALVLVAIVGCADAPAAPRGPGAALEIHAYEVSPAATDTTHHIWLDFQNTLLTINGRIETPTPCYTFEAYRTITGSDLTVTIVARASKGTCATVIDHYDWDLVTDTPPCPHLTIVYHYVGANWPDNKVTDMNVLCPAAARAATVAPPAVPPSGVRRPDA